MPIIEPEILLDGDHSIEVCAEVSERVFTAVMKAIEGRIVNFFSLLLILSKALVV